MEKPDLSCCLWLNVLTACCGISLSPSPSLDRQPVIGYKCSLLLIRNLRKMTVSLQTEPRIKVENNESRHKIYERSRKLNCLAIVHRCLRESRFSHFITLPACDRHTDTQGRSIYRTSMATRGKNIGSHFCFCLACLS